MVSQWTESNASTSNGCEIGLSLHVERGGAKIDAALSGVFDGA